MLGEPGQRGEGASQSRGALLFVLVRFPATRPLVAVHPEERIVRRRFLLLAVAAAVVSLPARRPVPVLAAHDAPTLTQLTAPNGLVRDTNGDNLPDAVAARVIVPS